MLIVTALLSYIMCQWSVMVFICDVMTGPDNLTAAATSSVAAAATYLHSIVRLPELKVSIA